MNNTLPKQKPLYSISEAAKLLGVSPSTLRRWEDEGRLIPYRTSGGNHRRYSQDNVKRLLKSFRQETDSRRAEPLGGGRRTIETPTSHLPPQLLDANGRLPPKIPVRTLEQIRQPFRRRKRAPHRLVDVTLLLISLALLYSVVTPLTQERLYRAFYDAQGRITTGPLQNLIYSTVKIVSPQKAELIKPGTMNPIVDVNDIFEYTQMHPVNGSADGAGAEGETALRAKITLIGSEMITQTLRVVKNGVFNTTQLLGTIFFGEGKRYFINRLGDATLRAATFFEQVAIKTGITAGTALKISFEKATQTGDLTGVEVDFSKITDPPSTLTRYGVHLKDAPDTTATAYGVYVEGTNWDYAGYFEDDVYIDGTLEVNDETTITGNLLPGIDSTFDIGAVDQEWANLYVDTLSTSGGTLSSLTVTGQSDLQGDVLDTTGDLTIADSLSQTGGGQVTFSGNLDANSGLDVSGITTLGDGGISNFAQFSATGDLSFYGSADAITAQSSLLISSGGDLTLDAVNATADSTVSILNSNPTYEANLNVEGDLIVGGSSTFTGHLLPSADDQYDLGSSTARWRDLYLGPSSLNIYRTIGAAAEYFTIGYDGTPTITFSSLADGAGTARNFNFTGGNVGIGTTSPDFALDVSGDVRIEGSNNLYFGGAGAAADVDLYRSAADTLKTDDTLVVGTQLELPTDKKVQFRDPQIYMHSGADGYLNLVADGAVRLSRGGASLGKLEFWDGSAFSINLYAGTTNVLETDDSFWVGTEIRAGYWQALGSVAFKAIPSGDTSWARFFILNSGKLQWGPGNAPGDTNLYRSAADTLKTDDSFIVGGDLTVQGAGDNTFTGHIIPSANDQYDLGSDTARWRDLYLGAETLHIGTSTTDEATFSYNDTSNDLEISDTYGDIVLQPTSGNVGIGTTSPLAKLAINGGMHVGGDSDPGDNNVLIDGDITMVGQFFASDGSAGNPAYTFTTKDNTGMFLPGWPPQLGFSLDGQERVRIDRYGNVGIGTTTPDSLLEVSDTDANVGIYISNESDTAYDPFISFRTGATPSIDFTLGVDDSTTNNDFVISAGSTLGTNNRLSIDGSTGDITTAGNLAVNGGDLTSTAATFNLLNATPTAINFGGAGTTISIGAGSGTTTVNNALTVAGTLTANTFTSSGVTITGGSINGTTIGATTPSTGAFTTLTSSGNSTIGTGASTTNTFGAGASSINTIGSATTPGALTLHGATTLDNTFTVSGSNLTSLGGNLTVTGTAWTATPTISGLVTMTSGFHSNAASTVTNLTIDGTSGTALNISNTGITTDIDLQYGETIDNDVNGSIRLGSTTLTLDGTTTLTASSLATMDTAASVSWDTTSLTLGGNATVYGSSAANENLTLEGTSNGTKTTSYVILQPTAGNVGIGETIPVGTLHVNASTPTGIFGAGSGAAGVSLVGGSFAADQQSVLNLQGLAPGNNWIGFDQYYDGSWKPTTTNAFQIYHIGTDLHIYGDSGLTANDAYTPTARLTIQADGNVGIGETSPTGKLHVAKDINIESSDEWAIKTKASDATVLLLGASTSDYGAIQAMEDGASWTNRPLALQPKGGNVGIGETSPARILHMTHAHPELVWEETGVSADNAIWTFMADGEAFYGRLMNDAWNWAWTWLEVQRTGTGVDEVSFPHGLVGIQKTGPNFDLDINGDIRIEEAHKLYFGGTGAADNDTNLYRSAANRLKTDDEFRAASHVALGSGGFFDANKTVIAKETFTGTSGEMAAIFSEAAANPSSASTGNFYGAQSVASGHGAQNIGGLWGTNAKALYYGTGTVSSAAGNYASLELHNATGTIDNAYSFYTSRYTKGHIGNSFGLKVGDTQIGDGTGTVTSNYGVWIDDQRGGSTDIGIRIGDADTYALQLASNDGDPASGITFGADTNLYRSAADTLKTDDSFITGGDLTVGGTISGGATSLSGNLSLLKTGTATAVTQYPSYDAVFQGSGWDTTLLSATDLSGRLRTIAGSGATGAIPHRLAIMDNTPTEFVSFDLLNQRVGILTTDPLNDIGGSYNYASSIKGLHLKHTAGVRLVIEGNDPRIDMFHTVAAANKKWLQFKNAAGKAEFWSLNDDGTVHTDNIIVMDLDTGEVGIGTANPGEELHISAASGRALIESTTNGNNVGLRFTAKSSTGTSRSAGVYLAAGDTDATTYVGIAPDDVNYRLIVDRGGNVGIGTPSPSKLLHVYDPTEDAYARVETGGTGKAAYLQLVSDNDDWYGVYFLNTGSNSWQIGGYSESSGTINFMNDSNDKVMTLEQGGNVGIGTANPGEELDVDEGQIWAHTSGGDEQVNFELGEFDDSAGTPLAQLITDDVGADILRFHILRWSSQFFWSRDSAGGRVNLMRLDSGGDLIIAGGLTQSGAPDIAENIKVADPTIEGGDVVSIDPDNNEMVAKSSIPYDSKILGVISSDPGIILNAPDDSIDTGLKSLENERPLTLAGRVPVKISTEGGPIEIGDLITSSEIPGVGMKATKAGPIVGKALEPFSGGGVGKILVFVNVGWYDPGALVDSDGDMAQVNADGTATKIIAQRVEAKEGIFEKITSTILAVFNKITAKTAEIAEAVIHHVKTDLLEAVSVHVAGTLTAEKAEIKTLEVEALSTGESSDTAGSGVIRKGEGKAVIESLAVTERSKIYVTFTTDYAPATRFWIGEKTPGESFTVELDAPVATDAKFDWWIVN